MVIFCILQVDAARILGIPIIATEQVKLNACNVKCYNGVRCTWKYPKVHSMYTACQRYAHCLRFLC